ncbi:MAG: hypothetical protein KAX49_13210 [Halanaerobiales bacterium]|nr:hypothetical protein [Halanaerobiales bacterium]
MAVFGGQVESLLQIGVNEVIADIDQDNFPLKKLLWKKVLGKEVNHSQQLLMKVVFQIQLT